jgi:chromate reductase, NAD(P)H dehydrogenase (quinone)
MKKVLAISGSTRKNSTNHAVIMAITNMMAAELEITLYDGLAGLPAFNPDNEDNPGIAVDHFRKLLRDADGVIICTPEYAHGVPGSLKNAIDWTVGSAEFSHKSTLLITASTDGQWGHQALLETLKVIEAGNIEQQQLLIQFAQTKIRKDGVIKHDDTEKEVSRVLEVFIRNMSSASGH